MTIRQIVLSAMLAIAFPAMAQTDSIYKESGLKRWWNSLVNGNVDRTFERRMDMSFVVAPCYTREGGFGIGGAATALYRLDRNDSIMQPSDFSLSGSASINGIYAITAKGNNHFRGNRARLTYALRFMHKTLDFWGISYDACNANPMSEYKKQQVKLNTDFVYKLTPKLHVGAALNVSYTDLTSTLSPAYFEGQQSLYFLTGIGISVQYDTRDFILNPKRGIYAMLREVVYPSFLGNNRKTLSATTLIFDTYQPIWTGGLLAFDIYGQLNSKNAPWPLREELGGGASRMRGYYPGRYIDCSQIAVQAELRQHISGRVGCVAWVGGGNVFPSLKGLRLSHTLPNYGLGLRIEFKHNANARIDYGFGKNTGGFVFQFAEAF